MNHLKQFDQICPISNSLFQRPQVQFTQSLTVLQILQTVEKSSEAMLDFFEEDLILL